MTRLIGAQPARFAADIPGAMLATDERVGCQPARRLVEQTDLVGVLIVGSKAKYGKLGQVIHDEE